MAAKAVRVALSSARPSRICSSKHLWPFASRLRHPEVPACDVIMKTVLVLSSNPAFPETIASAVSAAAFKIVHRVEVAQAEPLLRAKIVDVCIIDFEADQMQASWAMEQTRSMSPGSAIIAFIPENNMQWMEEAYLHGAWHVLTKPVRPRIIAALLERHRESVKTP